MLCWICNKNEANSGEHKFKSSLIRDMHGRQFSEEIVFSSNSEEQKIYGINSKIVKFPKIIYEYCNNTLTSRYDKAFDKLIRWSNANYRELRSNQFIDFEQVYGSEWVEQKKDLLKYIAKHAGCKIVTGPNNFDIKNISNLIYNDTETDTFQIKFILKEGFKYLDLVNEDGLKYISNTHNICSKNRDNQFIYFAGTTTYNWLSIAWVHTQNGFITNSPGFKNQKESIITYPIDELPEIKKDDKFIDIFDNQRMETERKQIEFYDTFI